MSHPDIQTIFSIRIYVKDANAFSSPLTWGIPSPTAWLGVEQALARKIPTTLDLQFNGVGIICHNYDAQVYGQYEKHFLQTRHPLEKNGDNSAIIEEGRIHLDITLLFALSGDALQGISEEAKTQLAKMLQNIIYQMKIAGGTVAPITDPKKAYRYQAEIISTTSETSLNKLYQKWMPGFALVSAEAVLSDKLAALQKHQPEATTLDAWLDICRCTYSAHEIDTDKIDAEGSPIKKIEWRHSWEKGQGWLVPLPVGYRALTPVYPAGEVRNSRDQTTPFCFVEGIYSIGEWISPYKVQSLSDLFWHSEYDETLGVYRCINSKSVEQSLEDDDFI